MATKAEEIRICPQCGAQIDIASLGLYAEVTCPKCFCKERVHVQLGNFRLEGVLGIGGMSVVYRAMDVTLKRPIALKVLNDTFRDQPERIERFENESAMMARVRHENVTSVYSAGRAYGQFYIAMELVEGKNLETMVNRGHPMQADYALEIVRQVANGLKAAGDAGLLHRDMKPGNVLITEDGQAKVIDFGLAMDNSADDQEEVIWATPYYVPPETLRREQEDVRTDIYALGMTLRYLLTGVESFETTTDSLAGLLESKRHLPPFRKQRPDIDASLCDLVDHMTAFAANRRPANYDELLEEIEEVQVELERQESQQNEKYTFNRKFTALIVLVLGCVIGLSIPLKIIPRDPAKVEALPVGETEMLPSLLTPLTKGLDLFRNEKYDEAARAFLQAARESQDPCIGATAAYTALILAHTTIQKDSDIEQQAQALLEQLIASKHTVHPAMEKAWTEFRKNVAWTDPTPSEWYRAQGGWQEETEETMNREADRLVKEAPTSPRTPVLLQELAERALWTDKPGVIDRCRRKLRELNGQTAPFAVVSQFFNRVFDERLRVRAVAKYVGRRDRIIEELQARAPTARDVDSLAAIASCDLLPQYFREQVKVQKEATEIAVSMCRLFVRKKKACKPEMSLRHMLWASHYAGEMPVLTCRTRAAGFYPTDVMDGKKETRWCAADTSLGENLQIHLPHPEKLSKVVMHWADEAELTYTLIARNRGQEVQRLQEVKHTNSTTYNLGGVEADSLALSLDKTDWHRSSVREIEIYNAQGRRLFNDLDSSESIEFKADSSEQVHPSNHAADENKVSPDSSEGERSSTVPTKVFQDAELVADIIDILDSTTLNNDIYLYFDRALQPCTEKGDGVFRMIAESWKERLRPGDGAKHIPPEPLGKDREAALNQLIDRCKRCRIIHMNKGYELKSLNWPASDENQLNVLDEQTIVFMNREKTLVIEPESETVAMLGIKSERKNNFNLFAGEIQPVPVKTALLFVESKAGVIVNNTDDLQPYTDVMKKNPTSYLFARIPRFLFIKK